VRGAADRHMLNTLGRVRAFNTPSAAAFPRLVSEAEWIGLLVKLKLTG
jgi:hypothetical protein